MIDFSSADRIVEATVHPDGMIAGVPRLAVPAAAPLGFASSSVMPPASAAGEAGRDAAGTDHPLSS